MKIILLSIILFAITTCKEEGTTPPIIEGKKFKDPREMVWKADTLLYPGSFQTIMENILGFSSKDIFIYGHCDLSQGKIYHYNGLKWEVLDITNIIGGYDINKMIEFGRNNIWGAGVHNNKDGMLLNYNGSTWGENKFALFYPALSSIDGEKSNDIYACGKNGIIWHYDGKAWALDTIKIKLPQNVNYNLHSLAAYKNEIFILASVYSTKASFRWNKSYFIKGKFKNWVIVDSMDKTVDENNEKWGFKKLTKGENGKLYSIGTRGNYEWDGIKWVRFLIPRFGFNLSVFSDNYMFDLGVGGGDFYNGQSWISLDAIFKDYKKDVFTAAWTDGQELFFIGYTYDGFTDKTIVLHGK